jgi:hypothetical protein
VAAKRWDSSKRDSRRGAWGGGGSRHRNGSGGGGGDSSAARRLGGHGGVKNGILQECMNKRCNDSIHLNCSSDFHSTITLSPYF